MKTMYVLMWDKIYAGELCDSGCLLVSNDEEKVNNYILDLEKDKGWASELSYRCVEVKVL